MRPEAATLRLAVFPRSGLLTDILLVVGGAGFVALCAQIEIHLGFTPVPITLQTFAVLLVGAGFGSVLGTASLALYVLVGMIGAPVYAGGEGGWEWIKGATGGYLVGFVVAAGFAGLLAERRLDRRMATAVTAMLTGNVIIYVFGLPWLAHVADFSWRETLEKGLYPFVVGDLLKLYLAGALLPLAWRFVARFKG
jgi:biotin transport system substrate-specific component